MKLKYLKEIVNRLDKIRGFEVGNIKFSFLDRRGIHDIYEVEYFCLNKGLGLSGDSKDKFIFVNDSFEESFLSSCL